MELMGTVSRKQSLRPRHCHRGGRPLNSFKLKTQRPLVYRADRHHYNGEFLEIQLPPMRHLCLPFRRERLPLCPQDGGRVLGHRRHLRGQCLSRTGLRMKTRVKNHNYPTDQHRMPVP